MIEPLAYRKTLWTLSIHWRQWHRRLQGQSICCQWLCGARAEAWNSVTSMVVGEVLEDNNKTSSYDQYILLLSTSPR